MSNINNIIYNNTNYPIGQTEDVELSKVLWENSNPTQSFTAQNITLDSDDYDYLIWEFTVWPGYPITSVTCKKGENALLSALRIYSASVYTTREATYVDDTHYSISANRENWNGGLSDKTDGSIPIRVIGVKNTIPVVAQKQEDIYSADEQKVGTWINGKPFYRKVISFLFSELRIEAAGYPGIYNFNIPNIEELLPFTVGSLYTKTRLMFSSFPCVLPRSMYYPASIGTSIDTDKILVYFSSESGITKGVFILYYTKTTD